MKLRTLMKLHLIIRMRLRKELDKEKIQNQQ